MKNKTIFLLSLLGILAGLLKVPVLGYVEPGRLPGGSATERQCEEEGSELDGHAE